jgi:hypothetical protein
MPIGQLVEMSEAPSHRMARKDTALEMTSESSLAGAAVTGTVS